MGPAPIVPGQHFRPAANGPPARPTGSNGFARPPRPQQTGTLQYGNAAKGIRPHPNKGPRPPANDPQAKVQILRNVLADNGPGSSQGNGEFVGGVFQAPSAPYVPKPARSHLVPGQIPQIHPVAFPRPMHAPPPHAPQNGHAGNGVLAEAQTVNGARGGRARGRGRGAPGARGRGAPRGRGGHSGQANAAGGNPSQGNPPQGSAS
jgi:hypothetical protein